MLPVGIWIARYHIQTFLRELAKIGGFELAGLTEAFMSPQSILKVPSLFRTGEKEVFSGAGTRALCLVIETGYPSSQSTDSRCEVGDACSMPSSFNAVPSKSILGCTEIKTNNLATNVSDPAFILPTRWTAEPTAGRKSPHCSIVVRSISNWRKNNLVRGTSHRLDGSNEVSVTGTVLRIHFVSELSRTCIPRISNDTRELSLVINPSTVSAATFGENDKNTIRSNGIRIIAKASFGHPPNLLVSLKGELLQATIWRDGTASPIFC